MLLKPLTFMNLSGPAVAEVARFYKIAFDDIIVIHDELDLPFAKIRVKRAGGNGGHNGLRSLDAMMGKDKTVRIRQPVPKQLH
jgi:PTH1 family peptidyl-tRNA hydrolase